MRQRFTIGDKVRLNDSERANECYAAFINKVLTVSAVSTRYMPAKAFYAAGWPEGAHPGFDAGAGCALYDCEGINVSLYDWELEAA